MELGWFRRNWLGPEANNLESFNAWLLSRCKEAQQHTIGGRGVPRRRRNTGRAIALADVSKEPFAIAETIYPVAVDGHRRKEP